MKKLLFTLLKISLLGVITVYVTGCPPECLSSAKVYHDKSQDIDKAIESLDRCVTDYPENPEVFYLRGQYHGEKGNYAQMTADYKKSLEIGPEFKTKIEQNTIIAFEQVYNNAVQPYNNAINSEGEEKQKLFKQAVPLFEKAVLINPEDVRIYMPLANSYASLGQEDKAIEAWTKAFELKPDNTSPLLGLANLYYNRKDYEKAIEYFDKALEIEPTNTDLLGNKAVALDLLGRNDEAAQVYQKALEKNPDDKNLLFNLGLYYFKKEEKNKAREIFEKVIELDPSDSQSYYLVGDAYVSEGNVIIDQMNKLDYKEPDFKEKNDMLNNQLKELFSKASGYLEKCVELDKNQCTAWYYLGQIYTRLDRPDDAKKAFDTSDACK